LIFNGYLSARPIVTYDPKYISGVKAGTIPVEDIFYGLALVSAIVIIYEKSSDKIPRRTLHD